MSVKKVAGLDLSMTATGVCHTGTDGIPITTVILPKEDGDYRLPEIRKQISRIVFDCDLVLIEMLPPSMKSAGITGMVQGVVRNELIEQGIHYGDVGPSSLKKYATGKGNASKTEMALAAFKRGEMEFPNDNECDAWWLWVMVNDHLGQPVFPLPQAQRASLKDIEMKG